MRTNNSLRNATVSFASQFVIALTKYASRTIFLNIFTIELLGLSGLFQNIISVLAISELGFGFAITTILYKPIADNDIEKIKTLINFAKKVYYSVAFFIFLAGLLFIPFINLIIKDSFIDISQIRFYFLIFLLISVVSYFNSNKILLIIADQKQYIEKKYLTLFTLLQTVIQIGVAIFTKNFALYLFVQLVVVIFQNIVISNKVKTIYPWINQKNISPLNNEYKHILKKNVAAMLFHKLGGVLILSSSNIIISAFIGLREVGLYSNYLLIVTTVAMIGSQFFDAVTASIGNYWVTENVNKTYFIFKVLALINFWLYSFTSLCLIVLLQPFIELWLGKEYLLPTITVFIMVSNYYFQGTRSMVNTFKNVKGLYWQDRYKPIFEMLVYIVFALVLVNHFGLLGVLLGTTSSLLFVVLWVEPLVLYKHGFNKSPTEYYFAYFLVFIFTIAFSFILYFVLLKLQNTIFNFLIRMVAVIFIPNILVWSVIKKTEEYKYLYQKIKEVLNAGR